MKNSDRENKNQHGKGESARENDGKVDGHSSRKTPSDDMGYEDRINEKDENGRNDSKDRDPWFKQKREEGKLRDMNSSKKREAERDQNREE